MRKRANIMFIAITQRLVRHDSYNELREALSIEWGALFGAEFGAFLPLPLCFEIPFTRYEQIINGCILSGGNDLNIFNSKEENKIRDEYEKNVIERCIKRRIPILGICRGAQVLAHFFGSEIKPCQNHIGTHLVRDKWGVEFRVNSFHNYAITHLGADLECLAVAEDNTIEAFKHKSLPFYALMWHIERENGLNNTAILDKFKQKITKGAQR